MSRTVLCAVAAATLLAGTAFAQNQSKSSGGGAAAPAAGAGAGAGEQRLPAAQPQGTAPRAGAADSDEGDNAPAGTKTQEKENGESGQARQPEAGQNGADNGQAGKPATGQEKTPAQNGQAKPAAEGKPAGAARAAPKLSGEQQTRVRTAFQHADVHPVHVDFRVSVGIAVPRTVVLEPVPAEIVTVVPAYEGFRFFAVPGQIVIVDPDTLEVVAVLPL